MSPNVPPGREPEPRNSGGRPGPLTAVVFAIAAVICADAKDAAADVGDFDSPDMVMRPHEAVGESEAGSPQIIKLPGQGRFDLTYSNLQPDGRVGGRRDVYRKPHKVVRNSQTGGASVIALGPTIQEPGLSDPMLGEESCYQKIRPDGTVQTTVITGQMAPQEGGGFYVDGVNAWDIGDEHGDCRSTGMQTFSPGPDDTLFIPAGVHGHGDTNRDTDVWQGPAKGPDGEPLDLCVRFTAAADAAMGSRTRPVGLTDPRMSSSENERRAAAAGNLRGVSRSPLNDDERVRSFLLVKIGDGTRNLQRAATPDAQGRWLWNIETEDNTRPGRPDPVLGKYISTGQEFDDVPGGPPLLMFALENPRIVNGHDPLLPISDGSDGNPSNPPPIYEWALQYIFFEEVSPGVFAELPTDYQDDPAGYGIIDDDGDGVHDPNDNASGRANADQLDRDRNGIGDVAELDCDATGWPGFRPGTQFGELWPCENNAEDHLPEDQRRMAFARSDGSSLFVPDIPNIQQNGAEQTIQLPAGETEWRHSLAVGPDVVSMPSPSFTTPSDSMSTFGIAVDSVRTPDGGVGAVTVSYFVPNVDGILEPVEVTFDTPTRDFIMLNNGQPVVGVMVSSSATTLRLRNGGENRPLPQVVVPSASPEVTSSASASPEPSATASPPAPSASPEVPTATATGEPIPTAFPTATGEPPIPTATAQFPSPSAVVPPTPGVSHPNVTPDEITSPTAAVRPHNGGGDNGCAQPGEVPGFAALGLVGAAGAMRKRGGFGLVARFKRFVVGLGREKKVA